ncbi:hypothetical protein DFR70_105192 [Nocardia tenerifensis]|uniref:Nucleotidyltransferase AbiEii toxin of type IV toxin-antitoxin system n=1 Tax=Nocardia tenerifensis TaxID=228006 RepID=A0A318K4H3_9NOCA|nr:hypothetical protein [Nocardia tenerifensis]PXX64010.1 hypothetical protein DFR70_105192 [Nocardia tenerifensis]
MIELKIASGSRAEDGAYLALADAAVAAAALESWAVIGGHMVNLHVLRSGVSVPLRATRDADLAVELVTIRDGVLLDRLRGMGYDNPRSGNRFERSVGGTSATIDLLAPSFTDQHVPNLDAGPIAVDGIPAVHVALVREPIWIALGATLVDGTEVSARIAIPDIATAISIKVFAYIRRLTPRDAEDIGRLLECRHADRTPWPTGTTFAEARGLLREHFDHPGRALRNWHGNPARVRALVRALTP